MKRNPLKKYHKLFHLPDLDAKEHQWTEIFQFPLSGCLVTETIKSWGAKPSPVKTIFLTISETGSFAIVYDLTWFSRKDGEAYYKIDSIERMDDDVMKNHFTKTPLPEWVY